jgi:hypothetical protein
MYSMALVAITKDLCEASKYNKHEITNFTNISLGFMWSFKVQ